MAGPEARITGRGRAPLGTFLELAAVLFVFSFLSRHLYGTAPLPLDAYESAVYAHRAFARWPSWGLGILAPLVLLWRSRDRLGWRSFEASVPARWLVFGLLCTVHWTLVTHGPNLYLGRAHALERILLVVLSVLVLRHCVFLAPCLVLSFAVWGQIWHPVPFILSHDSFARLLPTQLLVLFLAFVLVRAIREIPFSHYLVLALGTVGASYLASAYAKVGIGPYPFSWVFENRLSNLVLSAYLNGYLDHLPEPRVLAIVQALARLDVPFQAIALAIEAIGLFILLGRRTAVVCLATALLLHGMIFATTGVCFWKWASADVLLLLTLRCVPEEVRRKVFDRAVFVVSIPAIAVAGLHYQGAGWWDSNINQYYELDAVTASGAVYLLEGSDFAPYDLHFCQRYHGGVSTTKGLVGTYGTMTDYATWKEALGLGPGDYARFRDRRGAPQYDRGYAAGLTDMVRRHFVHLNRRTDRWFATHGLSAPFHIIQWPRRGRAKPPSPVVRVRIREIETLYDGAVVHRVGERVVCEIEVDPEREGAGEGDRACTGG